MNIKEYIESGIVGSYVLGLASEAEKQEFETLCGKYPELIEAMRSFELALEAQLMSKAVLPPEGLKERILSSMNAGNASVNSLQNGKNKPLRKINVWKMVAAACIILLCGSIYFSYSVTKKYEKLNLANIQLKTGLDSSIYDDAIIKLGSIVHKPTTKWSAMLEPANSSHCMAHIYWDSVNKNIFLLVGNIPKPVSDKQFQLWALLENDSVNLGIFDSKKEGQLIQMKNAAKARIFVITMEQKGGSSTPSMQAIYAVAKL